MDLLEMNYNEFISKNKPLPDRMRPLTLEEFIGQEHILGKEKILNRIIKNDNLTSVIFYGPPGTGKTTLARIIASETNKVFRTLNAVTSGVKDIKKIIEDAINSISIHKTRTILFIDEIHRFNKAQQDVLLPYVENGTIILIGNTTENPYFEVNSALLSRSMIFELKKLTYDEILKILSSAVISERNGFSKKIIADSDTLKFIAESSMGDGRKALDTLEMAYLSCENPDAENVTIDKSSVQDIVRNYFSYYDKSGENHYNIISAFIKSMRGSDPDAALYWLARMITGGEDPKFIARRMIIFASEDIGNADPNALNIAVNVFNAVNIIGLPEGRINLAQAVIYLSCAPKSNSAYTAIDKALKYVKTSSADVPVHLKNKSAPGENKKAYKYPHNYKYGYVTQDYLPKDIKKIEFYKPSNIGYEKNIAKYLEFFRKLGEEDKHERKDNF